MADEPSVLEDGSLLNSLSDHHINELLLLLKADAIARLRGTSHAIRAAVDLQMPSILEAAQAARRPLAAADAPGRGGAAA